ncbi:MAG: TlpA disulfide reductase family protein [Bacteroidales bacterium]
MKKLIFLIATVTLFSCSGKKPANESTVSGTILNNPTEFVLLTQANNADTIKLSADDSFTFTKTLERPGNYYLQANRKFAVLYLEPGKNLSVSVDAAEFDSTLTFSGDLIAENNYNRKINILNREISRKSRELYGLEPALYLEGITADRQARENMLKEFMAENEEISENFINSEMTGYEFMYYGSLLNFEAYHKYYAGVESVVLPDDWYGFIDNIDLNKSEYLYIPACLNVTAGIVDKKINESVQLGDDAWGTPELLEAQFAWIEANITEPLVAEHFMNSYLTQVIDYQGPSGIEKCIETYNGKSTNEKNKSVLAEKVAEWAPLTPGNDAPGFTLPDINGNEVSLSDFAGKYVYIDFWATWCGPCKVEIPVLAQLAEDYRDKNIVIMSISVDRDKQAWIDMVTKDKPAWLQLHDSIMMNDQYLVRYIPSFILIDREGKILNPRAPRPSSGEVLTSLLDSLEGI